MFFVLAFTLFFGLVHLPLGIFIPSRGSWFLVVISFTLGIVLPLVYLLRDFDFLYLYCVHWLFYIICGILYRTVPSFKRLIL
jgi:hypothetical protein